MSEKKSNRWSIISFGAVAQDLFLMTFGTPFSCQFFTRLLLDAFRLAWESHEEK